MNAFYPGEPLAAWSEKPGCLGGSRALSHVGIEPGPTAGPAWAFRTFHAFHLADYRTDPRPAAAGGLAGGVAAGGVVADRCRCCCIEALPAILPPCWPTAANTRSGPISVRRWRSGSPISRFAPPAIICSGSICWRSFARSPRSGRCISWRAPWSADQQAVLAVLLTMTVGGIQFARRRVRSPGAGAPAVGAAAAAFLAIDRPGPPQRLVCLVDRSRTFAADDVRRDRPVGAGRRICAGDRTRAAHAEVVRSAVRAAGDRGAGAALSGLADPRRHAGFAAMARDRRT